MAASSLVYCRVKSFVVTESVRGSIALSGPAVAVCDIIESGDGDGHKPLDLQTLKCTVGLASQSGRPQSDTLAWSPK